MDLLSLISNGFNSLCASVQNTDLFRRLAKTNKTIMLDEISKRTISFTDVVLCGSFTEGDQTDKEMSLFGAHKLLQEGKARNLFNWIYNHFITTKSLHVAKLWKTTNQHCNLTSQISETTKDSSIFCITNYGQFLRANICSQLTDNSFPANTWRTKAWKKRTDASELPWCRNRYTEGDIW